MNAETQDVVSLLVVAVAVLHLVWRGRCFYAALRLKGPGSCGGCGTCRLASARKTAAAPDGG